MCNYGGLCQQMRKKSTLQIILTHRQISYMEHASDASGKTKEHIKQLVSNKTIIIEVIWSK